MENLKIVQVIIAEFMLLGLVSDGVLYRAENNQWVMHIPNKFADKKEMPNV